MQCGLEDCLLIDLHQPVIDHLPVLLEMVLEEFSLEADGCSTYQIDAFRLHSVNVDMRVYEIDHLPSQAIVYAVLGQRQHAGMDECNELGVDDLQIYDLDMVVGIAGVYRDKVLDEHRQYVFFYCGHDYAHNYDDDLLVGIAFLSVVQVAGEFLDQTLKDAIGLVREGALEIFELVSDVGQYPEAQHYHVFIVAFGEV